MKRYLKPSSKPHKPNFFLLGGPKCATTSMSEYLKSHPNVCFARPKEPHFFNYDFAGVGNVQNIDHYETGYFTDCGGNEKIIAEKSVFYLRSSVAVPAIEDYQPNAKYAVMLRNPVDMVQSFHSQLYLTFSESEKDFETAWNLQEARKKGRHIPSTCKNSRLLQYGYMCKLGEQMEKLYERVSKERVHVIIFDDFVEDTQREYRRLLDFLDLEYDGRTTFPQINKNEKRNRTFAMLTYYPLKNYLYPRVEALSEFTKSTLGIDRWNILTKTQQLSKVEERREPIPDDIEQELKDYFADDVKLLSNILERDLTHWTR